MVFTRDHLRGLVENPRTFRSLSRVIRRSDSINYAEVGGEVYLTADERAIRFRVLPSRHEKFAPFVEELREGRYVQRHFQRLKRLAVGEADDITDGDKWRKTLEKMKRYESDGQLPADARKIADELKSRMKRMYKGSETPKLSAKYVCDFHVHNGGEPLSDTDKKNAEERPELVVVYNHNYNLGHSSPPKRQVSLVYVFPSHVARLGHRNGFSSEHFTFGTYTVESVGRKIRAGVA